jgi:hypothetical protein
MKITVFKTHVVSYQLFTEISEAVFKYTT